MNQFQGQAKLATPAVTNGGGETGLQFLSEFVGNCTQCHFDVINIHHYVQRSDMSVDQAVSALQSYIEKNVPAVQAKHTQLQGLPIMIGEVSYSIFNSVHHPASGRFLMHEYSFGCGAPPKQKEEITSRK